MDENGHPYIHMKEAQSNGEQNGVGLHSEERGVAVRGVQKAHSAHNNVQSVPGGHSEGDQIWKGDLQGARSEVTEESPALGKGEEQAAQKEMHTNAASGTGAS